MAGGEKMLEFGDFGDLAIEERGRISRFLQNNNNAVEVYWNRAMAGPQATGICNGFVEEPSGPPLWSSNTYKNTTYSELPVFVPHQAGANSFPTTVVNPMQAQPTIPATTIQQNSIESQLSSEGIDPNVQSGYTASGGPTNSHVTNDTDQDNVIKGVTKTYQRRNKKRRPPNYYEQFAEENSIASLNDNVISYSQNNVGQPLPSHGFDPRAANPLNYSIPQSTNHNILMAAPPQFVPQQPATYPSVSYSIPPNMQYHPQNLVPIMSMMPGIPPHTIDPNFQMPRHSISPLDMGAMTYAMRGIPPVNAASLPPGMIPHLPPPSTGSEVPLVEHPMYNVAVPPRTMEYAVDHAQTNPCDVIYHNTRPTQHHQIAPQNNAVIIPATAPPSLSNCAKISDQVVPNNIEGSSVKQWSSEDPASSKKIIDTVETSELSFFTEDDNAIDVSGVVKPDTTLVVASQAESTPVESKPVDVIAVETPSTTSPQPETPQQVNDESPAKPETTKEPVIEPPKSEQAPAKPSSWANLFKKNSAAASSVVIYSDTSAPDARGDSNKAAANTTANNSSSLPVVVPIKKDLGARQLGEILLNHKISHRSAALQPRGLINRSNWCYVNATLQALLACPPFYRLLKSLPSNPSLQRGPSSTPVTDSLVAFINEFRQKGPERPMGKYVNKPSTDIYPGQTFEPIYVYKMLQVIESEGFKHGRQEDVEEFLSCVLNGLHDEMEAAINLVDDKKDDVQTTVKGTTNGDVSKVEEGEGADEEDQWEQVGPKNRSVVTHNQAKLGSSPIAEIFGGQMRSILHQQGCKESATLQPFFTLQLDIQSPKVRDVKTALNCLVMKESIQGLTCSKTKTEVEASRKMLLERLPSVLVLHLKCFVYDTNGSQGIQKLVKPIDFDVHMEVSKDLLSQNVRAQYGPNQRTYKLFAVVNHHGEKAIGGHYTTDFFHPGINGWVRADDSTIKAVSPTQVLKYTPPRVPYLLYYRRADNMN